MGDKINPLNLSRTLGLAFVTIDALALLSATISRHQDLQRIERGNFTYASHQSLSLWWQLP
ncbi:hypothetical protein [Fischerella sp. JS2]|uniref:hypothetical protein n=1 Tax=Fischerella sp. JS2 TaxID=2597771 RepID=UPI0028E73743|nr:hypothetical protein [Fischerella sp. JS2]